MITGVTAIVDKLAFKGWPVFNFAYAIVEPFTKINNPVLEGGQKLQINAQINEGIINRGQIYLFQVISDTSRSIWPISCTCTGNYTLMVKQGWQGTLPSPGPGTYSINNLYKVFNLGNTSTIMPPMNLRILQ